MDDRGTSGILGLEMDLPAHLPFPALEPSIARAARVDPSAWPR